MADSVEIRKGGISGGEAQQIGSMLLKDELIIRQDLDFALEHQEHSKQLLGEILVKMGALDQKDLEKQLSLQEYFSSH